MIQSVLARWAVVAEEKFCTLVFQRPKAYTTAAGLVQRSQNVFLFVRQDLIVEPAGTGFDRILLRAAAAGSDRFDALITNADLTASRTYTLPDANGTFALTTNNLGVFATTTPAQLAGVISDETGTGALVFGTSPTVSTLTVSSGGATITGDSSVAGTFGVTGATTINSTGTAQTTIGNTNAATAVTIESGTTGRLKLTNLPTVTVTTGENVLVINTDTQVVSRITPADLVAGYAWGLRGNAVTDDGGTLGNAPTGNFLGTTGTATNARNLSFVTNDVIRAQISTEGVLSTQKDMTVNGVTVGRGGGSVASNTAVGASALLANGTDGVNNTAVGARALLNNTTGDHNSAMGTDALFSNTTGKFNSAMGMNALFSNTTGERNSAMGLNALYFNTTGSTNSAVGVSALSSNTTGSRNSAVGVDALVNNTTGSDNLALGFQAGLATNLGAALTSVSFSVFLGSDTRAANNNDTNTIVIGANGRGLGSNSVVLGNSSITATRLQGRVGINVDPSITDAQLQVRGSGTTSATSALNVTNSDNTSMLFVRDDGVVGIGTTNPSARLEVNYPVAEGTPFQTGGIGNPASTALTISNSNGTYVGAYAQAAFNVGGAPSALIQARRTAANSSPNAPSGVHQLRFYVNHGTGFEDGSHQLNGPKMTIQGGGNVGIGTTDPNATNWNELSRALHVYNDSQHGSLLHLQSSNAQGVVAVGNAQFQLGSSTNAPLRFYTNTVERMTILGGSDTRVGIGDNTPDAILEIAGSAESLHLRRADGANTHSPNVRLRKSRGTVAAPEAVVNGDHTGFLSFEAYLGPGIGNNGHVDPTGIFGHVNGQPNVVGVRVPIDLVLSAGHSGNPANNQRVRIKSDGRVGIGTTTPAYKTDVSGESNVHWNGSGFKIGGADVELTDPAIHALAITNTKKGGYDASLFFRQTDTSETAKVAGAIGVVGTANWDSANSTTQISSMYFLLRKNATTVVETMRISSSGVVVGSATNPGSFSVVGAATTSCSLNPNLTTGISCSSDLALKSDILAEGGSLAKILTLQPVTYRWKQGPSGQERSFGLIAQNVQAVFPQYVSTLPNGYLGLDYSALVTPLIGAVQEQQQIIVEQRDKLSLFSAAVQLGEGGFVGLGTSTPEARLHVMGDVAVQASGTAPAPATIRLRSSRAAGEAGLQGLFSFADASGEVLAGLAVQGTGTGGSGSMLFFTGDASDLTDPARASVVFSASGDVGIGTSAPGYRLDVRGGDAYFGGTVTATAFTLSSDARLKTNVQAIVDAIEVVRRLSGVSYDWNRAAYPGRNLPTRPQFGLIAQEVEAVLPQLVTTDKEGFKSVDYIGVIPLLVEGVKAQQLQLGEQDERLGKAEKLLKTVEERLFKTEEQVLRIDERLGGAEAFVARFDVAGETDTMRVLTPTFKVQNFTAERAYIAELRAERIEAERARFKELDADGAVIDDIQAARLRGRIVNTGGRELFVSYGTVAPLFEAADGAHYLVSVTAEDGSFATAQVVNAGGQVRVVPTGSQGIDVVANGTAVGLVAPSKKVKASWTRTG